MISAFYLKDVLRKTEFRNEIFSKAKECLDKLRADHIIVTGVSGLIFAASFNEYCGFPYVVVRKNDKTHSEFLVEGASEEYKRGVIVDDLVDSGATVKNIVKRHKEFCAYMASCGVKSWTEHKILNFILLYADFETRFKKLNCVNLLDLEDVDGVVNEFLKDEKYL